MMSVTLTGGSPWGFKMTGGKDFHLPLTIAEVYPGGKASKFGVPQGFIIEKVNGEDVSTMSHYEATNHIKQAGFYLKLNLSKPKPKQVEAKPTSNISTNICSLAVNNVSLHQSKDFSSQSCDNFWQHQKPAQSPSLYTRTRPLKENEFSTIDTPKLVVSYDIKNLIFDEEKHRPLPEKHASQVKVYQPDINRLTKTHKSTSPTSYGQNYQRNGKSEKIKAANNINKFFESKSAPRHGKPTFSRTLRNIASPLGDPVVLEIRLGPNLPIPSVHWYKHNKPIYESFENDIRILNNGPIYTLVIGELTHEMLGSYSCTIINKFGSETCNCDVTVSNQHQVESSFDSISSHSTSSSNKRIFPNFSVELYSNSGVLETYRKQVGQLTPRSDSDESEVIKALRDGPIVRQPHQTPSMKFLEESLLPESKDL